MALLEMEHVHAEVDGIPILRGLNLTIEPGSVHVIMGPNGAGKSTLARVLAGHPAYEVSEGSVRFAGQDLLALEPEERSRLGLFVSFQYPPEISGVPMRQFLYEAIQSRGSIEEQEFERILQEKLRLLRMRADLLDRPLHVGFSGGEKKRSEVLQMALLEPRLAILDETDSGLDFDALRAVAEGVHALRDGSRSLLVITHYPRWLELIQPDHVHIFNQGRFLAQGDASLVKKIEEHGYDAFLNS